MRDYPNLRDFLTALPEGIKRRKVKQKQEKKKRKRKKKKKLWDDTVSDLSRLKIPKQKLQEKKAALRSKNQEIAKVLIEQQKRKHFQRKTEIREQNEEDEEARLQRIFRRVTYNPVLEATKGEAHSFRVQEAGTEGSSTEEWDDEEFSSGSQELEVGKIKSKRITSSERSEMLDNILHQLGDFLKSVEMERKKTKEFRERALEIFERQGEKINSLEEEIVRLRRNQAVNFGESFVDGPQQAQRLTSRPFNPPPRVGGIPAPNSSKPLYSNKYFLPVSSTTKPAPEKEAIIDSDRYGLMGRSVFAARDS